MMMMMLMMMMMIEIMSRMVVLRIVENDNGEIDWESNKHISPHTPPPTFILPWWGVKMLLDENGGELMRLKGKVLNKHISPHTPPI